MNTSVTVIFVVLINLVHCRDFYVGMFKKNDLLVAQDRLYKDRIPYRYMYAKYGRVFKCKITYFRVADRLGYGPGPRTQIIRGGLNQKYLVLQLTSPYNMPISVNIYVGCANNIKTTKTATRAMTKSTTKPTSQATTKTDTKATTKPSTKGDTKEDNKTTTKASAKADTVADTKADNKENTGVTKAGVTDLTTGITGKVDENTAGGSKTNNTDSTGGVTAVTTPAA